MTSIIFAPFRAARWCYKTFESEIDQRIDNIIATAGAFGLGTLHLTGVLFNASGHLISFGRSPGFNKAAKKLEIAFGDSCSNLYLHSIKILNPHASTRAMPVPAYPVAHGRLDPQHTPPQLHGFYEIQQIILHSLNGSAYKVVRACGFGFNLVSTLAALVVGAVTTTFAMLAALVSAIPCLGLSSTLNSWAYDNLKAPAWMLNQLRLGLVGIFSPEK